MSQYKKDHPLGKRLEEAKRTLDKYPDRIPVIVERGQDEKSLPEPDKKKFLVPRSLTISEFLFVIRKRIKLKPDKALYMFVGKNVMPPVSADMSQIYKDYHDKDDLFLYFTIMSESTFGCDKNICK